MSKTTRIKERIATHKVYSGMGGTFNVRITGMPKVNILKMEPGSKGFRDVEVVMNNPDFDGMKFRVRYEDLLPL